VKKARQWESPDYGANATNTMLCYAPSTDRVMLIPWPDERDMCNRLDLGMSTLACDFHVQDMDWIHRVAFVKGAAMTAIVRDGCDSLAVHRALLGLVEYRMTCAPDMPGLDQALRENGEEYG